MPKQINLEVLLKDPKALTDAEWGSLEELQKKHPFSNLLSVVMAKKQYLESGSINNEHYRTAIFQQNNPAFVLRNVLESENKQKAEVNSTEDMPLKIKTNKTESTKLETKTPEEVKLEPDLVKPEKKASREKKMETVPAKSEKKASKEEKTIPEIETVKKESGKFNKPNEKFTNSDFASWLLAKDASLMTKEDTPDEDIGGPEELPDPMEESGTTLKEDILSESLAEIYVKQGLKQEAIEMYKKLSLKNPKKSTYFAEIIENLKKK